MAVVLDCITLDCADAGRLAAALGYVTRENEGGGVVMQPAEGGGPFLGFQPVPEPKTSKTRVHPDVRVTGGGLGLMTLDTLGAHTSSTRHVIMMEGNPYI